MSRAIPSSTTAELRTRPNGRNSVFAVRRRSEPPVVSIVPGRHEGSSDIDRDRNQGIGRRSRDREHDEFFSSRRERGFSLSHLMHASALRAVRSSAAPRTAPACRRFSMSGLPASSCSASTRADDGPRRHAAIMAVTASAGRRTPPRRCRPGDYAPSLRDPRLRPAFDKVTIADALHPPPGS